MQAIKTVYRAPTDNRCARIKASCDAGSLTVAWDHGLSIEQNHQMAAHELVRQLNWTVANDYHGEWVGGSLDDDYVWVLTRGAAGFTAG